MRRLVKLISFFALLFTLFGAEEKIHVEYYYSPTCEHCDTLLHEIIIPLQKQYPVKIYVELIDIDDESNNNANYARLVKREEESNLAAPDIPIIYIDTLMMSGTRDIREKLPEIIGRELAKLTATPKTDDSAKPASDSTREYKLVTTTNDDNSVTKSMEEKKDPIHLIYFFKKGCSHCQRVTYDMRLLKSTYPNLVIHKFDVATDIGGGISEHLSTLREIPDEFHLASPSIFMAESYILPENLNYKTLAKLIEDNKDNAPDISQISEEELLAANQRIKDRFKEFSPWLILGAGLIDGINPCAFGVIIFFVLFLSNLKRSKFQIFITGLTFTLSVFVTYLLVGAGFLKIITELPFFNTISMWIYAITAILAFILGFVSIIDFFRTLKGDAREMLLQLPKGIKDKIRKVIRKENNPKAHRNIILAAASTGFLVSIMELACTGQVYLPTLMIMTKNSDTVGLAWGYLFLYNLMFIIPLVIIFAIVMLGVSSQKLSGFLMKNTRWIKIILAILFFALAYFLARDVPFLAPYAAKVTDVFVYIFSFFKA